MDEKVLEWINKMFFMPSFVVKGYVLLMPFCSGKWTELPGVFWGKEVGNIRPMWRKRLLHRLFLKQIPSCCSPSDPWYLQWGMGVSNLVRKEEYFP
jgi:hypothetical protein